MPPDQPTGVNDYSDFWAPDPRCPRDTGGAGRTTPRRARLAAPGLVLAAALALVPFPAGRAGALLPNAPADGKESLDSLLDRSEDLSEEYNGQLRDIEGVVDDAKKAEKRAKSTQDEVDDAREQVERLAVSSYTNGGVDPALSLFVEDDPQGVIDRSSLVGHLSNANRDKIEELQQAIRRDKKAQGNADEKIAAVEGDLDELEERREKVQKLIADHPNQERRPPDDLTPRTHQMKQAVIDEFGENTKHGGVGCLRDGGPGEHPKGRACDFMVDANGEMPSKDQLEHGDEIAAWAKKNADRLGIMYIIWKQRIWDVRRGDSGWREMSDRGSMTENHFDHVHISMF